MKTDKPIEFFTLKIPELQGLDPQKQKQITSRCLESKALKSYRKIAPVLSSFVPLASGAIFFRFATKRWDLGFGQAISGALILCLFSLVALIALKLFGEALIIRALIRAELKRDS